MLEVCFDLSVEGLLKSAKNKFLGNDQGRVLSLAFALSLGNIGRFFRILKVEKKCLSI